MITLNDYEQELLAEMVEECDEVAANCERWGRNDKRNNCQGLPHRHIEKQQLKAHLLRAVLQGQEVRS